MDIIPYPGLRPFTHKEASIFFGRADHTAQLLYRLSQTRCISVLGPSGCGKSSLVWAGIVATLHSGHFKDMPGRWWVGKMRPGNRPLYNLARVLLRESLLVEDHSESTEEQAEIEKSIFPFLQHSPMGLVDLLRENPLPNNTNLLLIIDQFEDLFRAYWQEQHQELHAFVALLLASLRQTEFPIYVITTMRSEFLGDCTLFRGLPELINTSQYLVPRLTPEQQRVAMTEPARIAGGSLATELVDQLLKESETLPDSLPLLQHCLRRMWNRAKSRTNIGGKRRQDSQDVSDEITVTLDDYYAVGGLANALSHHADEAFWKLDQRQQYIAERIFRRLGDRRIDRRYLGIPVQIRELAEIAEVSESEVIDVLERFRHPECRFLSPGSEVPLYPHSLISLSHESLIRQWHLLRKWIEQEARSAQTYRRLENTARLWKQGKAALWGAPDLETALLWQKQERPSAAWAKRHGGNFDLAMEFLQASSRRRPLKRQLTIALAFLGGISLISLAGWGIWEKTQRIQAEKMMTEQTVAKPFHIRNVIMKDANMLTISPAQGRYLLKPGEHVTIDVEVDNPSDLPATIQYYRFAEDTVTLEAHYVTQDLPGARDMILIHAVDTFTGEILDQYIIKIKIIDTK